MSGLTPKKLEAELEKLMELGIIEPDGEYFKMTEDGKQLYTLNKAFREKAEEMEQKKMEKPE